MAALKGIWASARELGMTDEELHLLCKSVTGEDSLKNLNKSRSTALMNELVLRKPDTVTVNARNMQIKKEFNGYNYLEPAKKFNLSEVSVRRIISAMLAAHQTSFFDDLPEK